LTRPDLLHSNPAGKAPRTSVMAIAHQSGTYFSARRPKTGHLTKHHPQME
jgi:hypothetical protein